jgi:hypothetical protein
MTKDAGRGWLYMSNPRSEDSGVIHKTLLRPRWVDDCSTASTLGCPTIHRWIQAHRAPSPHRDPARTLAA